MAGVPVVKLEHYLGAAPAGRAPRRRLRADGGAGPEEEDHPPRGDPRRHAGHRHRGRAARPAARRTTSSRSCRARGARSASPGSISRPGRSPPPTCPPPRLPDELARLNAGRVPLRRERRGRGHAGRRRRTCRRAAPPRPDWTFDPATALAALKTHFQVGTLAGLRLRRRRSRASPRPARSSSTCRRR